MNFRKFTFLLVGALLLVACSKEKYQSKQATDANGYTYTYVTNDPQKVRIYTLKNGLQVYLSENKDAPRISTRISVRAGSTYDPGETTGLAHYFEHLMFKGSQNFGTVDWEKEKPLLDEIEALFEQHRNEQDPVKKKALYKKIDSVSYEASKFAIPNEYDKMVSALGAKGTNAGTSWEYTVYINEIPSNELKRWIKMEYDRFDTPVLRLFHTELETVYEEFNRYQDQDGQRQFFALMKGLFPNHPLGIPRLGHPEHLKNPSIKNIKEFYKKWYVPNNMAFILSGDLNYEETIQMIDKYWGKKEAKELPKLNLPQATPITSPVESHITGPDAESVIFAFRTGGEHSKDKMYVTLIDYILANSTAGLIDINLNQKQEILYGYSSQFFLNDYGIHYFAGRPKQGQSLEEVRDLLLAQLDSVKQGNFEDWMIEAAINDMQLQFIKSNESNNRVEFMHDAFVYQKDYAKMLSFYDEMRKLTKEDLMAFAKAHYKNNYVIVYKHTGAAEGLVKMQKPEITPVVINRDVQSDFMQNFLKEKAPDVAPVFVDFESAIQTTPINNSVTLKSIKNTTNELFELNYIVEMGKFNDLKLPLAVNYLPFMGTDKYSAEALQKEFYKLGITMNVSTGNDRSILSISGLQSSMEKGLALFEHVLAHAKPDAKAYEKYVQRVLKARQDAKLNPKAIRSALISYAQYGDQSPTRMLLSAEELQSVDPNELTDRIKRFGSYPHTIFYYGTQNPNAVKALLTQYHPEKETYLTIPDQATFTQQTTNKNDIFFVDYDKSQVDVLLISKKSGYDKDIAIKSSLFNEYYGYGMNSVVWQEIREARALAYSAYASYSKPSKKDKAFYLQGAVFTQGDKMMEAITTMKGLLNKMIVNEKSFELSRQNVLKTIQTGRIIKKSIFWTWLKNQEFDVDYDQRKDVYDFAKNATISDVEDFFNQYVKDSEYTYIISGKKQDLDMQSIKEHGKLKELSLEDLFGY